jgi:hypothetical protein
VDTILSRLALASHQVSGKAGELQNHERDRLNAAGRKLGDEAIHD